MSNPRIDQISDKITAKIANVVPEKKGVVRWPLTQNGSIPVDRGFAASLLHLQRKHGRVSGRKLYAHFRAANGRPFRWPVHGAA